ncbi:putative Calcium/calmodulin-dependent protein kinase [Candidatus Sulfopaludibacter sp. SbA6]|nr:putative Calcium/calmodulin-dependent protein kinase [Candidatus Sulfopaludibacter sp. SbA6]
MRPDRWRQVELLYHSALEREEPARDAFLREACRGDEELRCEVRSLLDQTESGLLNHPLQLGPYQIVGILGAGGMGTVYQARDTRLDRMVAIKVSQARFSARFEREARAVAALNHPHICTLYDVGPNYLVMEYIEGSPLQGPMPLDQALKAAAQIADALYAAHRKGIVHRDLKPGNVLMTESGVKVLDFGLAKMEEPPLGEEESTRTVKPETEEGTIVGTTAYMSPEQAEGKPVDARSDIFSFGAVLYEMVTGRRAFRGDTKLSILSAILKEEPEPASSVRKGIPHDLERIIAQCLRKDPERRFQHMDDVRVALEQLKEESDQGTAVTPASILPKSRPRPLAGALLGAGGVLVLLAVLLLALNGGGVRDRLLGGKPAPPLNPKRVAVAVFENRTGDPSLDNLGKMTAESVAEGLLQIPTIQVVPSSTVFELASGTRSGRARDPERALAEATGSGTVVSGAFYLQGQTLQVRASIMDEVAGQLLYAIEPANGTREKAVEAVESVRQRLIDAVAARYLSPLFDLLVEEVKPPRFEAQKEFAAGNELFDSDLAAAIAHYNRAMEIDPEFVAPGLEVAIAIDNQGKHREATAQIDRMEKTHARLTPIMRHRLDYQRAVIDGRLEEGYSLLRDIVNLVKHASGPDWDTANLACVASWTNRARESAETFRAHRDAMDFQPSKPLGAYLLMEWTGALHVLGEHEEELKEARWGRGIYPHLLKVHAFEARALVALGRIEEVEKLVEEILSMRSQWAYPSCCLPRATPAYVMLSAAEELRAHGHREASLKMAGRAVDWYRSRVGEEARLEDTRSGVGDALYQAERWDEAQAVFAALAAEHPDNIFYKGRLGALAARRGDRATALRIAEELRHLETPYLYGNHLSRSARIVALLGDQEGAVAMLRESVAEGAGNGDMPDVYGYGFIYRHSMDLESLHGYPPFEDLIKPKG